MSKNPIDRICKNDIFEQNKQLQAELDLLHELLEELKPLSKWKFKAYQLMMLRIRAIKDTDPHRRTASPRIQSYA